LFFDNRGCGQSTILEGSYTMKQLTDDAIFLANFLGWEKYHVVGVSMGGMISQHLALTVPEKVLSLSLLVTRVEGGFWKGLPTLKGIYLFLRIQLLTKTQEEGLPLLVDLLYPPEYLSEQHPNLPLTNREFALQALQKRLEEGLPTPPAGSNGQLAAIKGHGLTLDQINQLKNGPFPILALVGDQDILIPPHHSYKMPEQLGARLITLKGVGHGLLEQCPALVNSFLRHHFENYEVKPEPSTTEISWKSEPVHDFSPKIQMNAEGESLKEAQAMSAL